MVTYGLTLLRSATNIFLIEILSKYYELKTKLLQREDAVIERLKKEDRSLSLEDATFKY